MGAGMKSSPVNPSEGIRLSANSNEPKGCWARRVGYIRPWDQVPPIVSSDSKIVRSMVGSTCRYLLRVSLGI